MEIRRAGETWLYYRRRGKTLPLPAPEGSGAFLAAYEAAEHQFAAERAPPEGTTVNDAITAYLSHADYLQLKPNSQRDYRRTLDQFRASFGHVELAAIDEAKIDAMRTAAVDRPIWWNGLRSRMIEVVRRYRKAHPGRMPMNPWEASKRLKVEKSRANRPWPAPVLLAVLRAATPEFRALLIGYLLTAQRGSDVTRFSQSQYDATAKTLKIEGQEKTDEPILLHVPPSLATALEATAGRHKERLFVTPRGVAWKTANAQETLATLLRQLDLPRYTLHGLRATGPVALKMLGFENRAIRALTGHTSDQNLEVYLRGVSHYPLAKAAQEALEDQFATVMEEALNGANMGKSAGVTGRAAAKLKHRD